MHALLRFAVFMVTLLTMMAWEYWRPRRALIRPRRERWVTNLGLTSLNSLLVWSTVGAVAYTSALFAAEKGVGGLHWAVLPPWAAALATFFVLDFALYLQHVMMHAVPVLWRLHRVHHADLGFDATTGLRFHPIEIFLSLGWKVAVILLLGATPGAVLMFEIVLNAASVFNHGNVMLPQAYDRWLRWFLVTPDMHRIHHSARVAETNSNFGFSVPWWDRLCGTYCNDPALGQERMQIGLMEYPSPLSLGQLLLLPVRGDAGHYPLTGAHPART